MATLHDHLVIEILFALRIAYGALGELWDAGAKEIASVRDALAEPEQIENEWSEGVLDLQTRMTKIYERIREEAPELAARVDALLGPDMSNIFPS